MAKVKRKREDVTSEHVTRDEQLFGFE